MKPKTPNIALSLALAATISTLALSSSASAQNAAPVEIQAAQEAARTELRGQILAAEVSPGLTVGDMMQMDPAVTIDPALADARQIGGPRWIERDIVQVRLQLPADRVYQQIKSADTAGRVSPADLERLQRDWKHRTFQATGQAIPVARIDSLLSQSDQPMWRDVPQAARADAAQRAHRLAVNTIVDAGSSIRLSPLQTVEDAYASPDAHDRLKTWAAALPVTRVMLGNDRQVEVGVYVDQDGLNRELRGLISPSALQSPENSQALDAGVRRMPTVVAGRANAAAGAPVAPIASALVLHELPRWAGESLTADGSSLYQDNKLRTAQLAEQSAVRNLRGKLESLKIDDTTVGQLAARNPRVADAIDNTLRRARRLAVDYKADNSASVRVIIELNDLLDELPVR